MAPDILTNTYKMHDLWNRSEQFVSVARVNFPTARLREVVSSLFCPGPSYHYVVDFSDRHITHIHPSIKKVLGLNPETVTFNDIINQVHPDDIRPGTTTSSLAVILSNREMDIISLAAKGMKSEAIAGNLGISLHTVKSHRKNILHKTGTKTFPALIARCIEEKLL